MAAARGSGIVSPVELLIGTRKIIVSKQRKQKGKWKRERKMHDCQRLAGGEGQSSISRAGTEQQAGSQQSTNNAAINVGLASS